MTTDPRTLKLALLERSLNVGGLGGRQLIATVRKGRRKMRVRAHGVCHDMPVNKVTFLDNMKFPHLCTPGLSPHHLLLITPLLCACSTKPESQPQQSMPPIATTISAPSMNATLLAVAQTDATLRERPFCPLSTIGKNGTYISRADSIASEKYRAWVKEGYFTQQAMSQSQVKLLPTQRYLDILSHATNPDSPTPRICLGTARLSALTNLRQLNPGKFMAQAPLTPTLAPWVTPEIMKLFGPARNHPVYVPITLIFLRSGNTWTVERL